MRPIVGLNTVALGALKSSHNPTSRLFNWNTIIKELDKIGMKVDPDQKSLIVSGDHECIVEALAKVHEAEKRMIDQAKQNKSMSKRKKAKEGEQPIDIVSLDPNRALNETESTLEYIIVSICQALSLQPKQAAGLLTNHNHYLLHACIKGVKGAFDPILSWYQSIYATSKHLSSLALDCFTLKTFHGETSNTAGQMLLNALKCGFFSESQQVAEWSCKLFTKIAQDFALQDQISEYQQWYMQVPTQKNGQLGGGLEASLYALAKHPQTVETVTQLVVASFKDAFDQIIPELKANHTKKNQSLLPQLLCELLPYLYKQSRDETVTTLLQNSGILEECIQLCDPNNKDVLQRAHSLSLLAEIWSLEPPLIQENLKMLEDGTSVLESTLKVLKRACRDTNRPIRLSTLGLMFKLMDEFALVRNSQAPVLYKYLTFSLIENIQDDVTREFIMGSFTEIYQNHQSIPVSILVDPLLSVMQITDKQYTFNVFDFDFFAALSKHPKLTVSPFGIQLLDTFAKIYLNQHLWAQAVSVPLIILADRFSSDLDIQDFLMKFISISLTQLLSFKKAFELVQTKGKPKQLALPSSEGNHSNAEDDEPTKKIRRFNIIVITEKLLNLKISEDFNSQVKDMVFSINRRHKQLYGTMNKGLVHLLEFWYPKGKVAMDEYMKSMDDAEKKAVDDEEKRQVNQARKEEIARIKAKYYHQPEEANNNKGYVSERQATDFENQSEVGSQYGQEPIKRQGSQGAMRELVPWIHKEPKNAIEKKALEEIELIKYRREEKLKKQRQDEEKKKAKQDRKIKNAQQDIQKRKLELGISRNPADANNQQLVLYTQTQQETPRQPSRSQAPHKAQNDIEQMRLVDLDLEEEDRDRDGVRILLAKYQKTFKFLFNKYALSRSQHMKVQTFDYYGDKSINLAEINKLLRDHDVSQAMISKDQVAQIIRLVNNKLHHRLDLGAMDFGAFIQVIAQIAFQIFGNQKTSYPQEQLLKLIKYFEKATRSRGQSTLLYDDPDATSIGDQAMIKELNKRLKQQPDIIIPEGYYKVTEQEQIFTYALPEYLEVNESQKICIEVLDSIFADNLGFHFLEALVSYESKAKVKPRIKQSLPQPNATALQYMKPIVKKQFTAPDKTSTMSQIVPKEQFLPIQLGVDLKLALYTQQKSCISTSDKQDMQQVAEFLEEALQSVEKGLEYIPQREKVKNLKEVWNKSKEDKKIKEIEELEQERQREQKRLKRKQQLQAELELQKEDKHKQLEDQKLKQLEREKLEREKETKAKEVMKRKYDERKVVTEESKKMKLEDLQQRKLEEEQLKQKEKQSRQREQKDFLIKQKEKLGQEFQQRKTEKAETEKAQKELEEWKKEKQLKVKNQMESYIKQNKDTFKHEAKEREQIASFMAQEDTQRVFMTYDKSLEYLFKFYASQDKKEIGFNLANKLQTINFNEFVKFGYQTNITPTIVSNEDMVLIFRALVREHQESLGQAEIDEQGTGTNSLTYPDFKKALTRVAILGQDLLGGAGQRLEAILLDQLDKNGGKPPKASGPRSLRGRSVVSSQQTSKRQLLQKQSSTANIEGQASTQRQTSIVRKTKEQKMLEDIQKEKAQFERMTTVKIEEKRISKPFDVSIITPATIEGLLKYIQLQPDDNQYKLDRKLNQQRIEIQGQKPNKVKKSLAVSQTKDQILSQSQPIKSLDQQAQGGGADEGQLEGFDMEELIRNEANNGGRHLMEGVIGPDGESEKWQIEQA